MKKLVSKFFFLCSIIFLLGCSAERARVYAPQAKLDAQNYVDAGALYLKQGEIAQAKAAFEVAYDIAPISSAIDGLGCVAFLEGQYSVAEKLFKRAIQDDPEYADSLGNLALLYESRGKLQAAYAVYLEAVKRNPKNYRIRNNYAVFLAEYEVEGSQSREYAMTELKKAEVLASHPFISQNINLIRGN